MVERRRRIHMITQFGGGVADSSESGLRDMQSIDELQKAYPKVDRVLLIKWERLFSVFFDRNSSKKVDWGDFYLVSRKVRDIYGAESVQCEFARAALAALWEGLCKLADSDHDQLISINEWISALSQVDPAKPSQWFTEYRTFMFKLFDVSKDGVMDLAEYTDGMSLYGVDPHDAGQAFKLMAKDESAKLNPEEWSKLFNELFFSKDKTAAGNNLFGVISF